MTLANPLVPAREFNPIMITP